VTVTDVVTPSHVNPNPRSKNKTENKIKMNKKNEK